MFDSGGFRSELSSSFEDGEGLLDGVEVGRVFGQRQHAVSVFLEQFLHLRFVVEGRVVHDDEAVWPKLWQQALLYPRAHGVMRAATLKQHGRKPFFAALRHDEIGALAIIAADFSKDFFAARCPSMRPIAVFSKATFIEINHVIAAVLLHPVPQTTQIVYSATGMTFRVPRRFFYASPAHASHATIRSVSPKIPARVRATVHPGAFSHGLLALPC